MLRSRAIKNLAGLLLFPFALYFMFRWFEHSQIYHPSRSLAFEASEVGRPCRDVVLAAQDGTRLHGWFFPMKEKGPKTSKVFLICHGNGGNVSHRLILSSMLLEMGTPVFVFDYRGYGRSEGKPGEEGTYLDAEAAFDWLVEQGFDPRNIVAFGESLGGAIAVELALRKPLGAVVVHSSFTSVADVGRELFPWLPVRWMNTIRYDTRSKLARLDVPVLILHSREDTLIGFHHAERNYEAAREPKLLWEIAGGHNDQPESDPERFREGIKKLLEMMAAREKPGAEARTGPRGVG
jgi:hypothetical protein